MLKIGDKVRLRGLPSCDRDNEGLVGTIIGEARMCDYFNHSGKLVNELCYAVETRRSPSLNVATIYAIPLGEDHVG